MPAYLLNVYLNTTTGIDLLNTTHDVKRALRESQLFSGVVSVFLPVSCGGVAILESDPEVQQQLKEMIVSFVPDSGKGRPVRRSGTGRGEAHLRGALLPTSIQIPFKEGRLLLGAWQEIVVFDFDDKVGRREVVIHVLGEGPPEKKK